MQKRDALKGLRERANALKREVYALYMAIRDPRTPWYAKLIGAVIVAYALSPLDLIPDFIPVLGLLDDLILLPAGIALVLKLIPIEVMAACREKAKVELAGKKLVSKTAAAIVILVWAAVLAVLIWALLSRLNRASSAAGRR